MNQKKKNTIRNGFFILCLSLFLCTACLPPMNISDAESDIPWPFDPVSFDQPIPVDGVGPVTTQTPVFRWTKTIKADNFRLLVSNAPDIDSGEIFIDVVVKETDYTSPVNFENQKTFWWKVKANKGDKPGKWSEIVSFTVAIEGIPAETDLPPAPIPQSPEGMITDTTPVFVWTPVENADYYVMEVIQPDDSCIFEAGNITGGSYEIPTPLPTDINLRWKVKAVDADEVSGYYSDSIKTMYFTIQSVPPEPDIRPFPLNPIGVISTRNPTFEWIEALDSDNYWLIVADGFDISESLHLINTIVWDTRYPSPVSFENGKTYYWKVKSKKGDVPGNWSRIVSFTVNTGEPISDRLSPPFPVSPEGTIADLTPTFQWSEIEGADHYVLYVIRPDDSIEWGPITIRNTTQITPVTPLTPHKRLRWKVKAVDKQGVSGFYSDSMKAMYFTITNERLPAPYPVQPVGEIHNRFPVFKWEKVPGAVSYCLFVLRPDDSFAIGPIYTDNTYYMHNHSLRTDKYFRWKVKPYDKYDSSGYYSDSIRQMYFIIRDVPEGRLPAPVPFQPEGTIYDRTPTFSWGVVDGAEEYVLFVLRPDDSFELGPVYTGNTSYTPSKSLFCRMNYRWKVKALDFEGNSGYYSDSIKVMNFYIENPNLPPDRDHDGVSDLLEDDLMRFAAPIMKLHSKDVYRPCSVEWYLSKVGMGYKKKDGIEVNYIDIGSVTIETITEQGFRDGDEFIYSDERQETQLNRTNFFLDIIYNDTRVGDYSTNDWPCYAHVGLASGAGLHKYDVQYWVFYAYNGNLGPASQSEHEGDWEHVTARIEVLPDGSFKLIGVMYARHYPKEWKWYYPSDIDFENGRPVVYSAKHSHGAYTTAGEQPRDYMGIGILMPNDYTDDKGIKWDTLNNVTNVGEKWYPFTGHNWLRYSGRWGEFRYPITAPLGTDTSGPYGPAYKEEWFNEITFNP